MLSSARGFRSSGLSHRRKTKKSSQNPKQQHNLPAETYLHNILPARKEAQPSEVDAQRELDLPVRSQPNRALDRRIQDTEVARCRGGEGLPWLQLVCAG